MSEAFCEGERTYLRSVEQADSALIAAWKSDPLVRRMATDPDTEFTPVGEEQDIRRALKSDSQLYMVIVVQEGEKPIGYVRLNWMDPRHRFGWLRFALGERRGEGFGGDALGSFLSRLFADGAHHVEAEAYAFNEASQRLLRRLGFRQEGRKREAVYDGEAYGDVIVFGLLACEFGPAGGAAAGR
jgi:ribosomal-protein-alanine N-acetyltransferase